MQIVDEGSESCGLRSTTAGVLPSYLLVDLNVGNVVAQWLGVV